jgi:hypothetical protein
MPFDEGAAPNPFWDICTLVICKPIIRRNAQIGDWIVATGSTQYGFENKVVYAMEITDKMTLKDYDNFCKTKLPKKIPNWCGTSYKDRVGDCIYDYSTDPPKIRKSVHNESNRERDLGGQFALLSDNFYYFGSKPLQLPDHLLGIVKQGQGHKSTSNAPYFELFLNWISSFKQHKNKVNAEPLLSKKFILGSDYESKCAIRHKQQDDEDEQLGDEE